MGRLFTLALVFALLLATAAPVAGREPELTILYTGNTYGEIAPCPT